MCYDLLFCIINVKQNFLPGLFYTLYELIIILNDKFIFFQIITETMDAKKSLEEVQQRHEQILKLEKSIMELRDLFVDMAFLISKQVMEVQYVKGLKRKCSLPDIPDSILAEVSWISYEGSKILVDSVYQRGCYAVGPKLGFI